MNDTLLFALVALFSLFELAILGGVLVFYLRLRRSEALLNALQGNQEALLARIEMNARLEREIVATFAQRQAELQNLDEKLEERARDLRRLLETGEDLRAQTAATLMHHNPRTIRHDALAADAARLMEEYRINSLPAVDAGGHLVGALNTHDLMRAKVI